MTVAELLNEDMRYCKNCEYYVPLNIGMASQPIQACKKWKCDFKSKAEQEKGLLKSQFHLKK